jgi:hypothetical protein
MTKTASLCETDIRNNSLENDVEYKNINFMFANIQGLITDNNKCKIPYLEALLLEGKLSFVCLTETHLHSCEACEKCISDAEVNIPNYVIYRADRINRQKGGCCMYLHKNLDGQILASKSNDYVEVLIVKISKINCIVVTVYRPPNTPTDKFKEMITLTQNILKNERSPMPNVIMCGDFNFPFLKWERIKRNVIYKKSDRASKGDKEQSNVLLNMADHFQLTQEISENTREENCLDLLFTNNTEIIQNVTINKTIHSDHNIIEIKTCLTEKCSNNKDEVGNEQDLANLNFHDKNIDWDKI